jgi:hypothetical protein
VSSDGPEFEEDDESDPMDPASWFEEPDVCGSCIAWKPDNPRPGETVAAGSCRLRPELRRVPATMKLCSIYKPRGKFTYEPGRASPKQRRRSRVLNVVQYGKDGQPIEVKAPPREPRPPVVRRAEPEDALEIREAREPREPEEPREPPPPRRPAPKEIDLGEMQSMPVVRQALVELKRRPEELQRIRDPDTRQEPDAGQIDPFLAHPHAEGVAGEEEREAGGETQEQRDADPGMSERRDHLAPAVAGHGSLPEARCCSICFFSSAQWSASLARGVNQAN